ncbi:MAG: hypothetical protein CO118_09940 [Flavobacteriales bacterium CG_4_9_14_3_um_filter_32_8]|nr:MAG: hypothetical protein CO118_09940 [Flavobacteriales bacterium CG_4_9_14_3_um_filter_32_8]
MINNLNHIPLLRLLIPFIGGIMSVIYFKPNNQYLLFVFGIVFILYLILLLIKKLNSNYQLRWVYGVLIYFNFVFAGAYLTSLKYKDTKLAENLLTEKNNQLLIGEVAEPVQIKEKSVKTILSIKGIKSNNNWVAGEGKVIIYLQKDSLSALLNLGDIISFEPKLENVPPPKNPNQFDYRNYLSFHLIYQQAYLRSDNWKLIQQPSTSGIFKLADDSRKYLITILQKKGINGNELAVASALILGYKDDIDAQLKSAYSSAGAMHVLAVSGLHVGVIFLIFSQLFNFFERFKYGKSIKGILLIFILWFYALITGLSPSVLRAATMFSFVVAAKITNRNSNFFNTLAASALVLLIYNPLYLKDVGFQLSYLAVIGIVIIHPWIVKWLTFKWWLPQQIWEITAVSMAAQIATFPLGLLYFHQFPNYFMLANLVVIPAAVLILYLGLSTLIFSFIPVLGDYLAIALKYVVQFLNHSVSYIDKLPFALTKNIRFDAIDACLIYLVIASLILLIATRKFRFVVLGSSFLILFLISSVWLRYTTLEQKKLIVYTIPQNSAINFIDGKDNILVSDIKVTENKSKLLFNVQNNWIDKGVEQEKVVPLDHLIKKNQLSNIYRIDNKNLFTKRNYFQFYSYKIAIIDNQFKVENNSEKLKIDLLILTKNTKLSIKKLCTIFNVKEIVIDASNSVYNSERLEQEAKDLKIKCWSVLKDGAYQKNILSNNF